MSVTDEIAEAATTYIRHWRHRQAIKKNRARCVCSKSFYKGGPCQTLGYDADDGHPVRKATADPDWCDGCKRAHQLTAELPSVAAKSGAALRRLDRTVGLLFGEPQ